MNVAQTMVQQLARVLASEGMSGLFVRAGQNPQDTGVPIRFLLRHPGVRDDAIVNAYGVNAQIITMAHCACFDQEGPEKFDYLLQGPREDLRYVFDAVTARVVGNVTVAWTAYCRGKGV